MSNRNSFATISIAFCVIASAVAAFASGPEEQVLYAFTGKADGGVPYAPLTLDAAGNLYGTTSRGGKNNVGTVFELSDSAEGWSESVLYHFAGAGNGKNPYSGVAFDASGNLYGSSRSGGSSNLGTIYELSNNGSSWTESGLLSFTYVHGGFTDGEQPSSLLVTKDGIFATTIFGGNDYGNAIEIKAAGAGLTGSVLYEFQGTPDAYQPLFNYYGGGRLVADQSGHLYGTAKGGVFGDAYGGAVFQLTSPSEHGQAWQESVVYSFDGTGGGSGSGYSPAGDLVVDDAGDLYGTTSEGGVSNSNCFATNGCGTVFELSPSANGWTYTTLYEFTGGNDGAMPVAGLVLDSAGNLYGVTEFGGIGGCINEQGEGCGTVFELTNSGSTWTESILHSFRGDNDGSFPTTNLIIDRLGRLYGTTGDGGEYHRGVVFGVIP